MPLIHVVSRCRLSYKALYLHEVLDFHGLTLEQLAEDLHLAVTDTLGLYPERLFEDYLDLSQECTDPPEPTELVSELDFLCRELLTIQRRIRHPDFRFVGLHLEYPNLLIFDYHASSFVQVALPLSARNPLREHHRPDTGKLRRRRPVWLGE